MNTATQSTHTAGPWYPIQRLIDATKHDFATFPETMPIDEIRADAQDTLLLILKEREELLAALKDFISPPKEGPSIEWYETRIAHARSAIARASKG